MLLNLEKEYDKLLRQAESFRLDEKVVSDLWRVRVSACNTSSEACQGRGGNYPDCTALHGDICLLALPECDGVCSHYSPEEREEA